MSHNFATARDLLPSKGIFGLNADRTFRPDNNAIGSRRQVTVPKFLLVVGRVFRLNAYLALDFAKSNHSAIESTKIITERLASFNGSPNAGRVRAPSAAPMQEVRSENARDAGESCSAEVVEPNGESAFHQDGGNEAA